MVLGYSELEVVVATQGIKLILSMPERERDRKAGKPAVANQPSL